MRTTLVGTPGTVIAAAAALQPKSIMEWIVLIGAAVAALGVIHAKVIKPVSDGLTAMLESPARFRAGDERMGAIESSIRELRDEVRAAVRTGWRE